MIDEALHSSSVNRSQTQTQNTKGNAMKRIFIPTSSGSDWQRLLAQPKLHWTPGYSAMSAAACWEASAPSLPAEILAVFSATEDPSLANLQLLVAIPEWQVELPGGDRASQTDILAIARNDSGLVVLGVEAKVDEPFGPTLGEKRKDASPGQKERIAYLEGKLGCVSPLADNVRYQLMHRTVSALLTAQAFHAPIAVMLVQSFSPSSKWRADFDAFAHAVGAREITSDFYDLETDEASRLLIGWCRGGSEFLSADIPSAF